MAKFGKVARTLWHESWFRGLSDHARLLLAYLHTGPRGLAVPGTVLARPAVVADDLGWSRKKFAAALAEVRNLVVVDDAAGVMFVRSALLETDDRAVDYNRPGSKNAVIGWFQSLDDVPSGIGLDNILDALTVYANAIDGEIASVFADRLPTACARRSRGEDTPSPLTITRTNTKTITNTKAPRQRVGRPPADAGATGHQRVVDRFFELYLNQTGSKYEASKADFAHVKELVKTHGPDAVIARTEYLFTGKSWIKPPYTIGTLRTQWNALVPTVASKPSNVGPVAPSTDATDVASGEVRW